MHALFGTHKEAALPFFEQLLPDFHSLILVCGISCKYLLCSNITFKVACFVTVHLAVKCTARLQFLLSFSLNLTAAETKTRSGVEAF